jgi:uncharacterized protein
MNFTNKKESGEIAQETLSKLDRLKNILSEMGKVLVAFSGGVDSSFLLKVARDVLGENVFAIIASSETYPEKEREEAIRLAKKLNVRFEVIQTKELENPDFFHNTPERCYFCKMELFTYLKKIADAQGIPYILDGSNYEDTSDFRPGVKAASELGVRSPLKEGGLVKNEIRQLSRLLDLPTWNKPSMACLSSRFPYYTEIEPASLKQVARAEEYLKRLGFTQVRVRHHGQIARVEVEPSEFQKIIDTKTRKEMIEYFKKLGYIYITLDLAGFRSGSMNEPLRIRKKKP